MMPLLLCVSLILWMAVPASAQEINLRQAERIAIEQNLNLRAQESVTRAAEAFVRGQYGIYDPRLEADLASGVSREEINLFFLGDLPLRSNINEVKYRRYDFSLAKKFVTGAEMALQFDNQREDTIPEPSINPAYLSGLRLSLIQPLLQGFGREMTEREILFAVKDRQQEVETLREQVFNLVSGVRNAYFDVLRFRDNVAYRETSVELARQVLRENEARVEAGVLPPVENLEAEVGLQLRERELIDSQRNYEDALDRLTLLLNAPEQVRVAEESLEVPPLEASEETGFRTALELRPDIHRRIREIERLELTRRVTRNQLLPELNLGASYGHSGLGRQYSDTLDDMASDDFRSWEIGMTFSYPLGNTAVKNELLRTDLLLKGNRTLLAQLKDEVRKEIQAAIRNLNVNRKKVEVTELATRLGRERLQTLIKRKEVGLATTRDVLEGEEDLAQARTDHIQALAEYNQAVTEYLRATGVLLKREGIRLAEEIDPRGERPIVRMEEL